MKTNRMFRTAAVAAAAALTLGLGAPAFAESVSVSDGADTSGSLGDILDVTANYRARNLVVKVSVADLKPTSDGGPSSMSLFIDTDPGSPGPELRLGTGMQSGSDYQLVRMTGWKASSGALTCRHGVVLDNAGDVVRFKVRRNCLGKPAEVRVGVKMRDLWDGSHPLTDWLKHPRAFTRWLSRA